MPTTTLNVYPGSDRPCKLKILQDSAPVDFSAVTRMKAEFIESSIVADSNINSAYFNWSLGDGVVVFDFSDLGLPVGQYIATITEFDSLHPNGQPFVSPADGNVVIFNVVGEVQNSLIVENGSNVPNANSYVNQANAREYAVARGIDTLPIDDDALAAMLIQAMDYIEAKGCLFQGYPTNTGQALSWPRTGVVINCQDFDANSIPKQLVGAQVQLAIAISKGVDILPTIKPSDFVIEETVGPITTKYSDPAKIALGDMSANVTAVNVLLQPLMFTCSETPYMFKTGRA